MAENAIWERQPWDTDKSFYAFTKYYLSLDPQKRTVSRAWREYYNNEIRPKRKRKGMDREEKPVPAYFFRWASGYAPTGKSKKSQKPQKKYQNAVSWKERAQAYDDQIVADIHADLERRRRQVLSLEARAGMMLYERALEMIKNDPNDWTERDLQSAFDRASILMRRGAGLPERNTHITSDWREALQNDGVDPDALFEKTVEILAREMMSVQQVDVQGDDAD